MVCGLVLVGCGGNSGTSDEKEKFVVGMECNYTPFNWQSNDPTDTSVPLEGAGYADGYDVMIAQRIADELGKELVVKKVSWDGLGNALQSGEIDAIIAGMTASEDRELGIDFTTPYYESEMVMIVRKDDACANFTDIQQFAGLNVLGQKGTTYDEIIDQIKDVNHMTPKATYPEMVNSLINGEADALTAELPVAEGIISSNPQLTYITFAEGKGFDVDTTVSIGLREGTRGTDEFNAVQAALDKISQEERQELMMKSNEMAPTNVDE